MVIFNKQKTISGRILSMSANAKEKTYTIKTYYDNGKLCSVYRSFPQGADFTTDWTPNDAVHFLRTNDYERVK